MARPFYLVCTQSRRPWQQRLSSRASNKDSCCSHKLTAVLWQGELWLYELENEHTGHQPSATERWLPLHGDIKQQLDQVSIYKS